MKLQVQFEGAEEPLKKLSDGAQLQLSSQMSVFQHRVMNKQQPYHLILRARSKTCEAPASSLNTGKGGSAKTRS